MAAKTLGLPASLLAGRNCILAISRAMTLFLARMGAALQRFATYQTAPRIGQPARLVLQHALPAETFLLRQERALGAAFLVGMAVVRGLRVPARLGPLAVERAGRRFRAAGQRWMQHGSPAITRDLLEDSFPAGTAASLVAQVGARMLLTFEYASADSGTDVFRLDFVVCPVGNIERLQLSLRRLALKCLVLPRTAALSTRVPATVHSGLAHTETLRRFFLSLVTYSAELASTAAAFDRNGPQAWPTRASMADHWTFMSTWENLSAGFLTIGYGILTGSSRSEPRDLIQWRLSAWASENNIRGLRTVRRICVLRMTAPLTEMDTAVKWTVADLSAVERADPFFCLARLQKSPAWDLFVLRAAQHLSLHLATIALGVDLHLARATEPLVARPRTGMLSARQQVPTDLTAAPSIDVVCIDASLR